MWKHKAELLRYPDVLSAWHLPPSLRFLLPDSAWDSDLSWLRYLCLKLVPSLSCSLLSSFLWMFKGLSLPSPCFVGIDLSLSKTWVFILMITLFYLSTLNQLLCILLPPKYLSMQAGLCFSFWHHLVLSNATRPKWNSRYLPAEWFSFHTDVGDGSSIIES